MLILYIGVAVGLWAGIVTALGRGMSELNKKAAILRCNSAMLCAVKQTEQFDPTNEFQVLVAGCDVTVKPGLKSQVVLSRWRGAGVSHRWVFVADQLRLPFCEL
jgi:hypothetical protein